MALLRLFRKGFSIATRMKRKNFVGIAFLVVLFSATIILLAGLTKYETDQLVDLRGIVVEPTGDTFPTASDLWGDLSDLLSTLGNELRGLYVVYSVEIHGISIITVWPFQGKGLSSEIPWVLDAFKKSAVIIGRYIVSDNEALAHTGFRLYRYSLQVNLTEELDLGSTLTFESDIGEISFRIVGLVNGSSPAFKDFALPGESVLFVTHKAFENLLIRVLDVKSVEKSDIVHVRRIIITVAGEAWGDLFQRRDAVYNEVKQFFTTRDIPVRVVPPTIEERDYKNSLASFFMVLFSLVVFTIFYSFFMVKGAHYDVATLRAIGWSHGDVMAFMLGQMFFVIFFSWLIALFLSLAYYAVQAIPLVSPTPFAASLLFIALAFLTSYLLIRRRVLRIPPMEAFRRG